MYEASQKQWLLLQDEEQNSRPVQFADNVLENQSVSVVALLSLLHAVRRQVWKVLGVALAAALIAFLVSKRLTPLYEATATLEINPEHASDLLGPDAARSAWNDADQLIATQLRVIQEDSVLRPVVAQYNLPLDSDKTPDAPIVLKNLKVLRPPNTYLIQISYRSADPMLAATVANGIAESYLQHVFDTRLGDRTSQTNFMERQLDEVRASMEKAAQAVSQFEAQLGVVDPQDKTNIVSARLLQLSTEYTNAQADRIKKEADYMGLKSGSLSAAQQSDQGENLKQLQTTLNQAEQKFVEVQGHFGTMHPEYQKQAAILAGLQAQMDKARSMVGQRAQVAYEDARNRESILQQQLADEKASFDKLNAKSYQYQALKSEAEGSRKLYDDLERRIKESTINGGFKNGSTHISDYARPAGRAVFPRTGWNVGLTFAFALLAGIVIALVVEVSDDTIRSLEQIESSFSADVLGVIPQCELSLHLPPALANTSLASPAPVLFQAITSERSGPKIASKRQIQKRNLYEEAVRMLWSSFQLASSARKISSLLVTSAMPEEGKTTLITQLAYVHASHERRTLLIDADLRRPSAHRYVHVPMCPGLADVARGERRWRDLVIQTELHQQLDVLPAGAASLRSCDDIAQLLPQILAEASSDYDLVLVDGPPLLAFADPLHMASSVDGVIVVVCAEKTSRKALTVMLQTLRRVRANLIGIALNKVVETQSGSSYSYRDYNDRDNREEAA